LSPIERLDLSAPPPEPRATDGGAFPLRLESERGSVALDELLDWLRQHAQALAAAASRCGVVVLRGCPVESADDFDAVVAAFGWPDFPYADSLSNAVRTNLTPRVFTANEAPSDATIGLHHEMAQTPVHPRRLFFFCEQPARVGGATSLCRSDRLHDRLAEAWPGFVSDCAEQGVRYSLVMPPEDDPDSPVGRSWRGTFGCDDRAAVEARMAALGYEWAWLEGDCLRTTTPVLPAVKDLGDGRRSFFNQLIAARSWQDARNAPGTAVCLGDGRSLPAEAWAAVGELAAEQIHDHPWQQGDVALVDNYVVLHGRRRFEGVRRVLASLVPVGAAR
jgi:hypothetical protein